MGHKNAAFCNALYGIGYLMKYRGILYHLVINPCESRNKIGDGTLWIDQGSEFVHNLTAIIFKNGDFGNLVSLDSVSSGFYVNYGVQTVN